MPSPGFETLLQIYDSGGKSLLPLYSSRGVKQTMKFRDGAKSQRVTVNGELINLALVRMQKYSSTIEGHDVRPPSRDDVWPGRQVTIACAYLLQYPTSGGSPSRTVVSGSTFVEGNFTFYRPLMTFMIADMHGTFDEWQAGYTWAIDMNEI
jgi:hypothetical protein